MSGARGLSPLSKTPNGRSCGPSRPAAKPHKVQQGRHQPRLPVLCGVLQPRARVGSATAVLIDGNNSAGELAAPHIQSEARKLKLTLKTDACLRPGSVPRQAPGRPRSIESGTCPENSRGVRKISDKARGGGRANRHWRSPTMAAAGQPLACGEPPSSVIAATRLRALVQHVRRSVRPQNTTSLPPS